jgi:hypothetical protein
MPDGYDENGDIIYRYNNEVGFNLHGNETEIDLKTI